jgi:sugar lactone lactonase YvrE
VAVDSAGNVFVAEGGNRIVRKISPGRVVRTFAGLARSSGSVDGVGVAARFSYLNGVAVDSTGNVYVADSGNNTIRKVTPAAAVTTVAGLAATPGTADGSGPAARFSFPTGVVADGAGNIYIADSANHTIRKITPAGVVSTLAGRAEVSGSADGSGPNARFSAPQGLAADAAGNLYVADTSNHTIRKITPDGRVSTFAGQASNPGHLDGIGSAARFVYPEGVAVDAAGNVYVADTANNTIRKISPTGNVITLAGLAATSGSTDGTASAALFRNPEGIAVDAGGNVYVVDSYNSTIRKITPGAVVSTLAGVAGSYGSVDGTGAAARFAGPVGIAADPAGIVYVADNRNHTIRKITPDGMVKTVVGQAEVGGIVPGPLPGLLALPRGIALTPTGDLLITTNNAVVRAIAP